MSIFTEYPIAPEIEASTWLNTTAPLPLSKMKGSVVVIHAFQMLCPGCVSHGIPQTKMIADTFADKDVKVIGLHTVFEHHAVMTADALKAFIHEYRITFPVAIDMPASTGYIPKTMQSYEMRGTPTLILIDKNGRVRLNHFGRMDDMQVGKLISKLVSEAAALTSTTEKAESTLDSSENKCDDNGCYI
ncbi:redoxin domain-containing protein [Moritella sp. 36]|uniref:redoxin domain-containing protein n=1 Tax=Moritella sp. 36 TaxID=2746233 RepID=UPI001BAD2BE4|nr:redoxin domain-containing protein [Moritella sp. 36]QUM88742.1 redoxin domain-containing protein [Moritella sp. 36]